MSQIKGKKTKIERKLASLLRKNGIRYRGHPKLYGTPDFRLVGHRAVLFLDGCFWHGCKCKTIPATNRGFWEPKISANKERDRKVNRELKKRGWKVIRVWEHELKKSPEKCIKKIQKAL